MFKRERVNVGKVGVVSKNGDYQKVLNAGAYWLSFNEVMTEYDMSKLYNATPKLKIMLQDANFASKVELVDIKDNEIGIRYDGENFDAVLKPGKYFYWKGLIEFKIVKVDLSKVEITEDINMSILQLPTVRAYTRTFWVEPYEAALLFVDGKFVNKLTKGSYTFWKNAIEINVLKADLRQLQMEVSGQEMLTKDKAALRINFDTQYKVVDVEKALLNSKDFTKQLYSLIQLSLREYIGTMTLDELLDSKMAVAEFVLDNVKAKTKVLGVEVLSAGIKDVILPGEVKAIMNQVLVAQKQAQANTITRREETASTRSLLNTAKLMEDNAMLFKLKEMEYVEKIAEKVGEITVSGGGQVLDQLKGIFSK